MRLIFSENGQGIGIPYERNERPDGTNYGYFDLKRSPESISLIPELADEPALFRFIEGVNQPDSLFRSAGCALYDSAEENGERISYAFIHLLFEVLHWNTSVQCYRLLFEDFRNWIELQNSQPTEGTVFFSIGPISFWHHGFDGYSLRLYIKGNGETDLEARETWCALLVLFSLFVDEFNAAHQPQLQGCLQRVS